MASPSKTPSPFARAEKEWDLERLYADLAQAKKVCYPKSRDGLTETEKEHLLGLLCGYSPTEIAKKLHNNEGTVRSHLSNTVYRYIKERLSEKEIKDWRDVISWLEKAGYKKVSPHYCPYWEVAHDVSIFYDRAVELSRLEQWIVREGCRFVVLWGMGGIGKTALAVKLAKQIQDKFEITIWRSLARTPTPDELLTDLLQTLCPESAKTLPTKFAEKSNLLIKILAARRYLIVLDGVETLFDAGKSAGTYREEYQDYRNLFKQLGESEHESCVLLTSGEKPREFSFLETKSGRVRSLQLQGLSTEAAKEILREKKLVEEPVWGELIQRYRGNPLAIRIIAATIAELFGGRASEFLSQNTTFLGDIREILAQQLARLSDLESNLAYQMAIARQPINFEKIHQGISTAVPRSDIMEALNSLQGRSLVETISRNNQILFALPPVVRKYVITRFSPTASGC